MDAHCHLSDAAFDVVREEIYRDLLRSGILGLVLAGTEPDDWVKQKELDPPSPLRIARVFGIHPWWVDRFSGELLQKALGSLESSLADCQGLGEMGLDYFRAKTPDARAWQRRWFGEQLKIARSTDLPLVLHIVRAHHEAIPILQKERRSFKGLIHSYWANADTAKRYIDMGFLLSISPRILKEDPHGLLRLDPRWLVFETDTPYVDAQNQTVRPTLIHDILNFVAKARGEEVQQTVLRQEQLLSDLFPVLRTSHATVRSF
jgi:TatD DNase family protein